MQHHGVRAGVELVLDPGGALLRRAGRGGRQPLGGEQPVGELLQVVGGADGVERTGVPGHERVLPEPSEHLGVPAVGPHQHGTVALEVRRQPPDQLAQPRLLVDGVLDRGEHRPDPHRGRVAPGALGGVADHPHHPRQRLVGEEGVQHDPVGDPAGELQRPVADGHHQHRDPLVEGAVLVEVGVAPGGPLVPDDGLAAPEPAVDADGVLHLGTGDAWQPHQVEQHVEAASEAQRVAALAHPVRRRGHRGGHQRVPGHVVGRRGRDAEPLGDTGDRAGHHPGVLDVEPLGEEERAEPDLLGEPRLGDHVARGVGVAGQAVAGQLRVLHCRPWTHGAHLMASICCPTKRAVIRRAKPGARRPTA